LSATTAPASDPRAPGWLRRLLGYVLRHRTDVAISFGAAVLGAACQAGAPLLERQIVDGVIVERSESLLPWLIALVVVAAGAFLGAHLRRYRGGKVALEVQYDLRNEMQAHLQKMDFAALDQMPTGQLVARASSDTTLVQGLLMFIPMMSGNLLLMVLSLGVMLWLSPPLALVSLIIAPALIAISYRMRTRIFPATWDAQQREGEVIQIVDEAVGGVRVVKAFGQERRELERVAESSEDLYGSQMRAVRLTSRYQPLLQAIPAFGQVAILAFGGWLALRGDISLGTFLAFTTYIGQLVSPTRQLAGLMAIGQQARAGVERIFQLLDLEPDIQDAPDAVELGPLEGDIDFDDVHFGYDERREVLAGFDLHVKAGERVAIVGPSGSGKTTATQLVSRFYEPDRGAVLVDGHDLRGVTLHSLRSQVGVVFEEAFLFSDSVRANIAYGRPEASDAEIETAARVAQAHDFVTALPRGYDSVVGERGLTLSGGQRQRIALARAVLQDPRILILDDATSAVDARTEEAINEGLRTVLAERTTLLVAHRRSTLHLADRVVVLDEGRIIDQGTHEELVARSAIYRGLLTGLDDDVAEAVEGRVEALSARVEGQTTAAAWSGDGASGGGASGPGAPSTSTNPRFGANGLGSANLGGGLGKPGGVRGGAMGKSLAPTPQLLAQVAKLRPVRDEANVDLDREARHQRGFTLRKLLREFRVPLLVGLVLVVLDALAGIAGPVLVKEGIDGGVATGSQAALFTASAIFAFITLADLVDEVGETFVTGRTAQRVMLSLRIRIWAQLQRLGLDYYEREMAGRIMTRMTTDVDQFEALIENGLLSALVAFATFFGVGVALLVLNFELGLATLSVIVPLALATVAFRRRSGVLYDQARDRIAIVNADFQESLSGVREAQAAVHEAETERRFRRLGDDYLESRVGAQRLVATYFPFVQFLSSLADVIVLAVGAQMIHEGHLTTGVLIAFILYVDMFFSPIQQLSQVFDSWQQTRISVARIDELMALETRTPPPEAPLDPGRLAGAVTIEGVSFSYPEPTAAPSAVAAVRGPADARLGAAEDELLTAKPPEALKEIDLAIEAGETVALVGETGAGKSTMVKLLARFYDPDSGRVAVDDHDLRELDLPAYRHRLGYVPQEAFLFTGSIRDNIAYGRPEASNAEVEKAARAVGAHDFIAALPGGYGHQVAERGRSLSAGERQLIALARAELVNPAILLLDEATSNLDLANEARVVAAMQQLSADRTTIVIAHRLQTARTADRIVLLDAGRIAEVGTHDELLALEGHYAAMWQAFEALSEDRTPA
jgi:ATP-binding cassette, subfamily B, bacterial